jgi:predicted DNA-binding ribbon-helix-helix protein
VRTTIDLDEELLRTAKSIADARHVSLSKVICELAWKGLAPEATQRRTRNGFPLLRVNPGARPVTAEHVADLMDEFDNESVPRS